MGDFQREGMSRLIWAADMCLVKRVRLQSRERTLQVEWHGGLLKVVTILPDGTGWTHITLKMGQMD